MFSTASLLTQCLNLARLGNSKAITLQFLIVINNLAVLSPPKYEAAQQFIRLTGLGNYLI